MRASHLVGNDGAGSTDGHEARARAARVIDFGGRTALSNPAGRDERHAMSPNACIPGCSITFHEVAG